MSAYLVRLPEDHQLVGLFNADDLDALFHIIYEINNPYFCELLPVRNGGIFCFGFLNGPSDVAHHQKQHPNEPSLLAWRINHALDPETDPILLLSDDLDQTVLTTDNWLRFCGTAGEDLCLRSATPESKEAV